MRSTRFLAAGVLLALVACSSLDKNEEQRLAMHREFANAYFDKGQYQNAEAQVDLGLELAPSDDKLLLMKAWICLRRGKPEDVLEAEKRFRRLSPAKDYRVQLGLAETLERKGVMYSESADAVERGERPTKATDRVARAAEMRKTAQASWKDAVTSYNKTLDRKSGEIQAINGLQRTWALLGNYTESLKWSNTLLEQSTGEIAFWRKQLERPGITADDEERLRSLLNASTRLLLETHLQASTLAYQLGSYPEALEHLDKVVELDPDNVQAYGRRALLRHKLGKPSEDVQHFLKLSSLSIDHPDMQRALTLLGECEREIGATAQEAQ
jgi:tetratricopeptide (TPR) repeat protein